MFIRVPGGFRGVRVDLESSWGFRGFHGRSGVSDGSRSFRGFLGFQVVQGDVARFQGCSRVSSLQRVFTEGILGYNEFNRGLNGVQALGGFKMFPRGV